MINYNCSKVLTVLTVVSIFLMFFIFLIKKFVFTAINHFVDRYDKSYVKLLKSYNVYYYLLNTSLSLYFIFINNFFMNTMLPGKICKILNIIIILYATFFITTLFIKIIDIIEVIYKEKTTNKSIPVSLHSQILKIFVSAFSIIVAISSVLNISLSKLFASFGALTAFLTFIFKDTISSLFASLQLTMQDIIRIGDWINVMQYDVEGKVESITISLVKIRNFDNTISSIPTATLLSTNIKNWRGITELKARSIKRSIIIDTKTIIFCSPKMLNSLKELHCFNSNINLKIKSYIKPNTMSIQLTNIQLFRIYIKEFLKTNKFIYQENFTFLVRDLELTPSGLPLEIYVFTKEVNSINYEEIQSEIFEHLIAIMPKFRLKISCRC